MSAHQPAGFLGRWSVATKLAFALALVQICGLAAVWLVADGASGSFIPFLGQAVVAIVSVLVVLIVAFATVGRALASLGERVDALGRGELDTAVPCPRRGGEVGTLARSLDSLRLAMLEKRHAEETAAAEREALEVRRQESDGARVAAVRLQAAVVRLVGAALARVAEGDLTARLKVDVPRDYGNLKDDFNQAMDRLQETMDAVVATGRQIRAEAAGVFHAAGELAQRAGQQAAEVEQVAAATREVTRSLSETANGVGHARSAIEAATEDAGRGRAVIGRAITAMSGIERSSEHIGRIVGVIDEVAFQTNLLALNAAVEAARAGDAGRGFTVVAQEVRALAQRCAEAAREIKTLISTSSAEVRSGVQLVAETGSAIERLAGKVGDIGGMVTTIARGASDRATSLRGVDTVLNAFAAANQENAAAADQFTAASRSLARQARMLAVLAGHLREEAAAPLQDMRSGPRGAMPGKNGAAALAFDEAPRRPREGWQAF